MRILKRLEKIRKTLKNFEKVSGNPVYLFWNFTYYQTILSRIEVLSILYNYKIFSEKSRQENQ